MRASELCSDVDLVNQDGMIWAALALKLAVTVFPVSSFNCTIEARVINDVIGKPQSKTILIKGPEGIIRVIIP